jgi:putative ABC transport system substrate-binding protein
MIKPCLRRSALLALALLPTLAGAAEVAVLKSTDAPAWRPAIDAMRRAATGHNVTEYDLRGDRVEADRVVALLKPRGVLVVALGPLAAQAAHEGAPELSLIFGMVPDPAKLNLSGPSISGVAASIPVKNQLAAFRMVNPRGTKVGVVYSEENVGKQVAEALKAAPLVRIIVVAKPVTSDREVPAALRSLLQGDNAVDAIWIPPDPMLLSDESRRFILGESLKAGKPVYSFSPTLVQEGALVSNAPDMASIGEQLGDVVNRMAGGEKTRIETLIPRAELVINKKIADKLKIDVPADALKAANRVF